MPLRLAQPPHEGLEQGPGDLRVLLDERAELPRRHPAALKVGAGDDRRRPGAAVDQRDLAEMLAGAEGPDDLPADADGGVAVLDHEEADPALALLGDLIALVEAALGHPLLQLLQLLRLDAGEQRYLPQRLLHVGHRGASYPWRRHRSRPHAAAPLDRSAFASYAKERPGGRQA